VFLPVRAHTPTHTHTSASCYVCITCPPTSPTIHTPLTAHAQRKPNVSLALLLTATHGTHCNTLQHTATHDVQHTQSWLRSQPALCMLKIAQCRSRSTALMCCSVGFDYVFAFDAPNFKSRLVLFALL